MDLAPFHADTHLPEDWRAATLLGRIDRGEGPSPALIKNGHLIDLARTAPTTAHFIEDSALEDAAARGEDLGPLDALKLSPSDVPASPNQTIRLLAPIDLQCVKAAGVTFAVSALERVIEERARGDAAEASAVRARLEDAVGAGVRAVTPGSPEAETLKAALIAEGMWSQYLEVAIGPDAEVFTKAPILSSVGWGMAVGVRSDSKWNNPEPEIVLVVDSHGRTIGATLGNDVNLRDFEGRSALLLGKAKDNNASCSVGPFVRLFDEGFSLDDVRSAEVRLDITGEDGFTLSGVSHMNQISRDPETLVAQTMSEHHYPDGLVLFLGTMFAPTKDRDGEGQGFTHHIGDLVTISSPRLGSLSNRVTTSKAAPPWTFGVRALIANLASRGLLERPLMTGPETA